ncbi:ARM repeat-containing protein [Pisolithus orientalis]|uniref:ARM repeat-containing protein n=1 Tax=Pisolithus orientalis TaxID=936130 RepID=UPI0022243E0B|nr:ARM repeat-containing protein [Pisolithus orientalis]KAI5999407.1 ARM repeat-containing protein [Pisolithus orientalis]
MEGLERHIRSWFASEKAAEIEHVISALSSGESSLLDIVKALGEYLTSEEDTLRTKGMWASSVQFLSLVIEGYPKEKLNRQAVHVLATFYCTKLEDTETITPALRGLSHLVKSPALASSDVPDLLNAMFTHVKMRVLVQTTRFFVFNTIDTLLKSHPDDLKAMGDQFVEGYAALASGEKDPRNLTVAFAIARVILTEFDISKHVEDYFDITFCYFPITFRPPPNDPYGISADDLKSSLLPCLSATPAFGRLGVPLFLEKLTAGSPVTKRDTLRAMSQCLPVYGPSVAREFGTKLWSALKLEIFQPVDPATEKASLDTLQVFVRVLQSNPVVTDEGQSDNMDDLVRTVCVDCLEAIGEPEKPQATAGMKILCSFLTIAQDLSSYAVAQAADKLVTIFHDPMEVSNRPSVITLLTDLLNSLAPPEDLPTPDKPVVTESGSTPLLQDLLAPSKDAVLGLLIVGLKAPTTRVPSLHGLAALIRIPSAVTKDELGYIVLEVSEFVGKEPDEAEDVTSDVLSLLSSIAILAPQHLASQRTEYWRALSSLSQLCAHPELFETFVIRLTTKLDLLRSPLPTALADPPPAYIPDAKEMEPTAAYAHAILTALANTLSAKVSKSRPDADVPEYINTLLPHLFRLCLEAAIVNDERVFADIRLLRVVARVIRSQNKFFSGLDSAYLGGQVKSVTGGEFAFSSEEFKPMDAGASTRQRNTVLLYAAAHVPMKRDVSLDAIRLSGRLADLITWCSSDNCTPSQREAASHVLASLVNKRADDIPEFLDYLLDNYWSNVVYNRTISVGDRRNAVALWASITRALLVRSHPSAMVLTDKLFILIDDGDDVGWEAAHALGMLATRDEVLTKRNHAILKILYAQKYLDAVLPRILEAAQAVTGSRREAAYLVALASVLNAVPKALYLSQMPKLMPLLIRGLGLEDPALRVDIINILTNTVDAASDEKSSLTTYASALVLVMLKNSMVAEMPDSRVRIAALKYLALLPGVIRYDILHPYKVQVLKDLGKVLDDPRRAVRKEAVDARTKWQVHTRVSSLRTN